MESKGWLITKIILKSFCCIIGILFIALAILQYVSTAGTISDEERLSVLVGQVLSGAFVCGIWLMYQGTIVAIKKAGFKVKEDIGDPSFWDIISVTKVTYWNGDVKYYSDIRGSFIAEIVIFFIIFSFVQMYYIIFAPILGIVSLIRDIVDLSQY